MNANTLQKLVLSGFDFSFLPLIYVHVLTVLVPRIKIKFKALPKVFLFCFPISDAVFLRYVAHTYSPAHLPSWESPDIKPQQVTKGLYGC